MNNKNKKLIIVGAGVTGLSAGIHALKKGYDVEIYEKNDFPGGCCTGWVRKGYYIDNCMHWLTGTNQHTKSFKLWKRLGAIDETSNLYQGKYFYKSTYNGDEISLLTDTKKLHEDMIKLSPSDFEEIDKFIKAVDMLIKANKKEGILKSSFNTISGYLNGYLYYHKLSLNELAKKFHHPLLQKLFTDYLPGDYSAFTLLCAYAVFASGNGKVYEKGSKQFALNIANEFTRLGGKIFYNSAVEKIEIQNDNFKYIISNDKKISGDYLIYAADPMHLFTKLISIKYIPNALKKKFEDKTNNKTISSFHVAFLVDKNIPFVQEATCIEVEPIKVGKEEINRLLIKDYPYLYQNKDKKVVQLFIVQNMKDIEYWQGLYRNDKEEYKKQKEKTVNELTNAVVNKFPELKNHFEVIDSWTPMTYNNYFNTYHGSYMGFIFKKNGMLRKISPRIKGVKNMFFITYWQTYMGGLPIGARLGEDIVNYL